MNQKTSLFAKMASGSLVLQILVGIIAGVVLATVSKTGAENVAFLGELFVGALKAIAPILVFILVAASIANQKKNAKTNMRPIVLLYLFGTFCAALTAVLMSFAFPTTLVLVTGAEGATPPEGIAEVLNTLMFKVVDNPVNAIGRSGARGIGTSGAALSADQAHEPQLTLWPETRNPTANLSNRESNSFSLTRAQAKRGAGSARRGEP